MFRLLLTVYSRAPPVISTLILRTTTTQPPKDILCVAFATTAPCRATILKVFDYKMKWSIATAFCDLISLQSPLSPHGSASRYLSSAATSLLPERCPQRLNSVLPCEPLRPSGVPFNTRRGGSWPSRGALVGSAAPAHLLRGTQNAPIIPLAEREFCKLVH